MTGLKASFHLNPSCNEQEPTSNVVSSARLNIPPCYEFIGHAALLANDGIQGGFKIKLMDVAIKQQTTIVSFARNITESVFQRKHSPALKSKVCNQKCHNLYN